MKDKIRIIAGLTGLGLTLTAFLGWYVYNIAWLHVLPLRHGRIWRLDEPLEFVVAWAVLAIPIVGVSALVARGYMPAERRRARARLDNYLRDRDEQRSGET